MASILIRAYCDCWNIFLSAISTEVVTSASLKIIYESVSVTVSVTQCTHMRYVCACVFLHCAFVFSVFLSYINMDYQRAQITTLVSSKLWQLLQETELGTRCIDRFSWWRIWWAVLKLDNVNP
uniref:Uncharacterized protein n=1 Tax=Rhipicephalus zambeziensis TaxID=60191 RepID=A0A224YGT2_9ACAR